MQDALLRLDQAKSNNIYDMWRKELSLRYLIRESDNDGDNILISNHSELNFLYRSLYFWGRKVDFFNILLRNLHKMQVLKWIREAPSFLLDDFWVYLPWYIDNKQRTPEKLQFIVNLYNSDYHEAFKPVINILDLECCSYLLSRTANPELRKLLQNRESDLLIKHKKKLYDFDNSKKTASYPTIYGERIENILETIKLLQKGSLHNYNDPYCSERFRIHLEAGDMLFRCGMVEDCLALLLDIYNDYQQKNRLVSLLDDEKIHRTFYRLLRRVVPVYALLKKPLNPCEFARNIYTGYFTRINADPASIQYLTIYESILAGFYNPNSNIIYEIYIKSQVLNLYRSAETPLIYENELKKSLSSDHLNKICEMIQQKNSSLPHESFIMLEYIRLCHLLNMVNLGSEIAAIILDDYTSLWKWLPASIFMHDKIYSQIAPLVDEQQRSQTRQICAAIRENKPDKLENEISSKPNLFKRKGAGLKREMFSAHFLGVL